MGWVLTRQLQAFREQMNATFPHRDKTSDGTIGDAAHQAESSGHNPDLTANAEYEDGDGKDEVRAIDVDSDTGNSDVSMEDIVQHLLRLARAGKLGMIRYMIFNRRIWSSSDGWVQRAYSGASPHTEHLHLSGAYNQASDELASANYHLEDLVALTDDDKAWMKANLGQAFLDTDAVPNVNSDQETNPYVKVSFALRDAGVTKNLAYNIRDSIAALSASLGQLAASVTTAADVDEQAVATALLPILAPALIAALQAAGAVSLTEEQVEEALRNVLRSV